MVADFTFNEMPEAQVLVFAESFAEKAYVPYSHFAVGAVGMPTAPSMVVQTFENAAYTPTNCAELTAFFQPF